MSGEEGKGVEGIGGSEGLVQQTGGQGVSERPSGGGGEAAG